MIDYINYTKLRKMRLEEETGYNIIILSYITADEFGGNKMINWDILDKNRYG